MQLQRWARGPVDLLAREWPYARTTRYSGGPWRSANAPLVAKLYWCGDNDVENLEVVSDLRDSDQNSIIQAG